MQEYYIDKLLVFIILFVLIFITLNTAHAIPPPDIVYRIDSRPPNQIFATGFQSWGDDEDLLRHVSGESINNRTSALISTTSNWMTIEQMARTLMGPNTQAWVYAIRPSINFHDINGSLINSNMQNAENINISRQSLALYRTYSWQEEFAAYNTITNRQIHYAQAITSNAENFITISPVQIHNAAYEQRAPQISHNFLNATNVIIPNVYYLGDFDHYPVEPAHGFDGCPGPHHKSNSLRKNFCKIKSMENTINIGIRRIIITNT
ncbi:scabin-related ADP-ribosyltransferase [Providencia burhodogranariea]|uniref:Pertussis toxin subunit 1 n=1 Tax=Providencia burhodogranariea DSM 19968 TaxID=1141662 RepID=K8WYI6_9GAMM|nr:enterotoxin A family protein [Providencia burhodogranariea]EKT62437.1 hypothetical protein OOA_07615 [Providencia burhodogranariea DSM 19968]